MRTSRRTTLTSMPSRLPRRRLLETGGLAALALVGCDALETSPASGGRGGERGGGESPPESPVLAELVASGELPPVAERLPRQPLVVEPTERIGRYGGTWRGVLLGLQEAGYVYSHCQCENLVRWREDWSGGSSPEEIIPNLAESFEVDPDGRVFTFRLRPGTRWSDGEPFTGDDVVFAVNEVLTNPDLFPVPPALITVDAGTATAELGDDEHTVRIIFPEPAGLFPQNLATSAGHVLTHFPRHYAEQFLPDHNPNLDHLLTHEGAADWIELFGTTFGPTGNWGQNVDLPTLGAWRLTTAFGDGQRVVLDRNPFYWKTDPAGSQLPYIDSVVFDLVNDIDVMLLKATNGEIDLEVPPKPRFTNPANKPVLAQHRQDGTYRFVDGRPSRLNIMIIQFNLNHPNPTLKNLFTAKDFRIGLSHAINRREIIDATMQHQGEPHQTGPLPDCPFYHQQLATQYLDYDPDLANHHLDKIAPNRDNNGLRLDANGKPIRFTITFAGGFRPEWAPMLDLIHQYWRNVGVDATPVSQDRLLFIEQTRANKHDVAIWHGDGGLSPMIAPHYIVPVLGDLRYAVAWKNWYTGGPEPTEEPPPPVQHAMNLYTQLTSTIDPNQQAHLLHQILNIAADQFYTIGIARETNKYFTAKNNLHNIPKTITEGWEYCTPAPTRTEQYFFDS